MASIRFSHYILPLFIAVTSISTAFSAAERVKNGSFFNPKSARTDAEKLIRSFNLFPELAVNNHVGNGSEYKFGAGSGIVERKFKFPFILDSGDPASDLGHHAGYYKLPDTVDARMFYFFFESRGCKQDPVVIWLTGGPGCSSALALFHENGPFHVTSDLSLTMNEFGWDQVSNIIFVDQPTGTGFSYSSSNQDIRRDEEGVSNDLDNFLQAFFKGHPQFTENDFYIAGESFAGHYIPALASRIQYGNKNNQGIHLNLKGLAIGNGYTSPGIQYAADPDYALIMKLINRSEYKEIRVAAVQCIRDAKLCETTGTPSCSQAHSVCQSVFESILSLTNNVNYYDIRKQCEGGLCYDFSDVELFLNQPRVREALGVGDIQFVSCSSIVYDAFTAEDWMRNFEAGIPAILEDGIKLLVYAGEYDLICNWLGNSRWTHAMEWSGQKSYASAPMVPFLVDGREAGLQKGYGPLTFLKVHDAGHLVPMDQPKASLEMLERWMQGKTPLLDPAPLS